MKLQDTGEDRARLYIPAKLRDSLDLTRFEYVAISLDCKEDEPLARITPVNHSDEAQGVLRTLTLKSNGQVQVDFPRQVAVAVGLLDTELVLQCRDDHLALCVDE